jgi:hypothetical protein
MHSILDTITASFSLVIIRNRDAFSSYPAKIKAFFYRFPSLKIHSGQGRRQIFYRTFDFRQVFYLT